LTYKSHKDQLDDLKNEIKTGDLLATIDNMFVVWRDPGGYEEYQFSRMTKRDEMCIFLRFLPEDNQGAWIAVALNDMIGSLRLAAVKKL
jgi:hypothetical protein